MKVNKTMILRLLFSILLLFGLGVCCNKSSEAAAMKSDAGLTLKEGTIRTNPSESTAAQKNNQLVTNTDTGTKDDWLHRKPIGRLPMTGEQLMGSITVIGVLLLLFAIALTRRKQRKKVKK